MFDQLTLPSPVLTRVFFNLPQDCHVLRAVEPTDNFPSHPTATLKDCPAGDKPALS